MCRQINAHLTEQFPGDEWICKSADAIDVSEPDEVRVGEEVLNAFDAAGLPEHELKLKPHMPVMLLRNLDPNNGLCNGTRLLVIEVIQGRLLKVEIVTGTHRGNIVFIPRICLIAEEGEFPFKWSRRQFPVTVAFAMTINKAQGQTLQRVGVFLRNQCFAHGQLYVAASRVGHPDHIRFAVAAEDGDFLAKNVVYKEVLT